MYDEETGSNDYYTAFAGDAHGRHVTYRQAKFSDFTIGYQLNASVTLTSQAYGGYFCNYAGGL